MAMHGRGGEEAKEKIFLAGESEEGKGDKKGSDNGIEHVGSVEDFSRGESGSQS